MHHEWIFGVIISCIGIIIGVVTALRRTFLFRTEFNTYKTERDKFADDLKQEWFTRLEEFKKNQQNECNQYRESCSNLHKKDIKLQEKELEMRDQAFSRLEEKVGNMEQRFMKKMCSIESILNKIVAKMGLDVKR